MKQSKNTRLRSVKRKSVKRFVYLKDDFDHRTAEVINGLQSIQRRLHDERHRAAKLNIENEQFRKDKYLLREQRDKYQRELHMVSDSRRIKYFNLDILSSGLSITKVVNAVACQFNLI